jgi:hypothetical protein
MKQTIVKKCTTGVVFTACNKAIHSKFCNFLASKPALYSRRQGGNHRRTKNQLANQRSYLSICSDDGDDDDDDDDDDNNNNNNNNNNKQKFIKISGNNTRTTLNRFPIKDCHTRNTTHHNESATS